MTFYEAALRVLESEGRPLTFLEITERSIAQNLLSHVGKTPELTMLSRLAAMARRTRDRKVVVTAKDTFALADWALPEDPEALAQTGVMEAHPEESLPPLRPVERHPEPRTDNVRVAGRGSERKRRRDEEEEVGKGGRRRRFPPIPEVVFEILSEVEQGLRPEQILEQARTRELAAEDATVEALLTALLEDNQRRIDAGRRPQFSFSKESGAVVLERAGAPSEAPPLELQAAFAAALGIPLEDGRPVLPRAGVAAATPEAQADAALLTVARTAVKDARKAVARALRKRLGELDVGSFEKSVVKMMHALGFRELKVAKRSKEGPLLTARKREGSVDLRYAIRMLKGTPSLERKAVQELRKDLGHYSAQVGLLACAGDVRGDARTEAQASGSLVMLWCGDALGEKFLEAKAAVTVTTVELYDLDERFFEVAKLEAEEAQKRREERQREKQARAAEEGEGAEETEAPRETEASEEAAPSRREERKREREERKREREERREERRRERQAAAQAAQVEAAGEPEPVAVAPTEAVAPAVLSEEEQGEEGEDEGEGEDEDLEAASAFVGGGQPEGGAPGEGASASERKRRRRRRRGRRGRGSRGVEGAPGAPGEASAVAEGTAAEGTAAAAGTAAAVGVTSAEGAVTAEASQAAATATGAMPSEGSEGLAAPGEAVRTAAEWQSPFPSVESSAPAEAQRTAAEESARAAAEKVESAAEGARA
ncbi:HTH domain-containing protein, partial [Archangium sp.]|uniref:HTH domain-containing protein n=1 Tax=Archangium sp. TaxID=1872627 RepID=UPI002D741BD8